MDKNSILCLFMGMRMNGIMNGCKADENAAKGECVLLAA